MLQNILNALYGIYVTLFNIEVDAQVRQNATARVEQLLTDYVTTQHIVPDSQVGFFVEDFVKYCAGRTDVRMDPRLIEELETVRLVITTLLKRRDCAHQFKQWLELRSTSRTYSGGRILTRTLPPKKPETTLSVEA